MVNVIFFHFNYFLGGEKIETNFKQFLRNECNEKCCIFSEDRSEPHIANTETHIQINWFEYIGYIADISDV